MQSLYSLDAHSPFLLAAGGLESILTLVAIVVLSAINSWMTKRKQEREARENPPPYSPGEWTPTDSESAPPPVPRRNTPSTDWEEEMRRLLGGPETPAPTPSAPPPLPPSVPQPAAREYPRPQPSWNRPSPEPEEGPEWDLPPLRESPTAMERAQDLPEQVAERLRQASASIAHHREAQSAMAYADGLEQRVAAQSRHAIQHSMDALQTPTRRVDPELIRWVQSLRNPSTARAAFISGIVLGPPKGLE